MDINKYVRNMEKTTDKKRKLFILAYRFIIPKNLNLMKHLSTIFFLFICAFLMSYCTKKKEITETAPPKTDTLYGVVGEGTSMHLLQL